MPLIELHLPNGTPFHCQISGIAKILDERFEALNAAGGHSIIEWTTGELETVAETRPQVVALIDAAESIASDPFRHVPGATSAADLKAMRGGDSVNVHSRVGGVSTNPLPHDDATCPWRQHPSTPPAPPEPSP